MAAELGQRVAAIVPGFEHGGVDRERRIEAFQRLDMTLLRQQERAVVDQRLDEPRPDRKRLLERGKRVRVAIEPLERAAAHEERIGRARVDLCGLVAQMLGFREVRRLEMQEAEREQRFEIPRLRAQDIGVELGRFGEVARVACSPGLLQQVPHASAGPTAKCAGGSPFWQRSHMIR